MDIASHVDKWLSLDGNQDKLAYLLENADPLMGDEAEAALVRRLEAATDSQTKAVLQEHLNLREQVKAFAKQIQDDPLSIVVGAFEQAKDMDNVAKFVTGTPDELLDQLEQRMETNVLSQTGNARAMLEARLKGLRAVREAEKAFNEAKDLGRTPVERAVLEFLRAETEEDARAYALANKDLLLTAQGQGEIDTYRENDRVNERKALLRHLRLELASPLRPRPLLSSEMETETGHSQSRASGEGETVSARQSLTYDRCQFGNNNVMINNTERVPLEWMKPEETGKQFWEGAVGRKIELSDLYQKLLDEQKCSLLSVHGLPAIGKSTLAALYAHTYANEYPGGVIWMQYRSDVRTAEQAKIELRRAARFAYNANPEAIEILDNKYAVEPDVVQALLSGHGRLLIIVDDVWTEAVALTVRKALPADAHVLLTTRDSDVAGAFVNHKMKAMYELDVLTDADARLLLEEIAPNLPEDVVEKLVTGLDGHAQALTIAGYTLQRNAYRGIDGIRADCDNILRRVHEGAGFGNLSEVKDDLRERIQKFEAVLKYSYDRLETAFNEGKTNYQPYFRALGTLPEGADFSADAFASICHVDDGAKILSELRQCGLVKMIPGGALARWNQHAILRAYALGLQTPDEGLDLPERYSDYVITLVQACHRSKPRDYERLEMEFAHAVHAFEWCCKQDYFKALQIVQYCNDFMMIRGRSEMLGEWQKAAIEIARTSGTQLGEANTLKSMGDLASRLGQVDDALQHYQNALKLYESERDQLGEANTLKSMGDLVSRLGQVDDALQHYQNALKLFRTERAQLGEANTLQSMGDLARRLGQVDDALQHYQNALKLFRTERDQLGEANTLKSMGDLASRLGQVDDALQHYQNALKLYESERDITGKMNAFISMARLKVGQDKIDEAKSYYEQAFTLADSIGFGTHEVVAGWRNEYQLVLAGVMPRIEPEKAQELQDLADLLIEWVKTTDWGASEQYLIEHQEKLLTEDAVRAMQLLIQSNNDNPTLRQHLQILQLAIEGGIEGAYDPLKQSPFEQLREIMPVIEQVSKPQEMKSVIAMWLILGERFLQQETIPYADLTQFVADGETVILPKAEKSGEAQLIDGCKHLLGWAYNTLTNQYDNEKDYPHALAAISKAIEYQPQQAMYYRNRAGTYMDLKDYAKALPDLEKAQELEPDAQRLPELWKIYKEVKGGAPDHVG